MDYRPKFQETAIKLIQHAKSCYSGTHEQGWVTPIDVAIGKHYMPPPFERIKTADAIIKSYDIQIDFGGHVAAYSRDLDKIIIPEKRLFKKVDTFYGTIFHEIAHSTGHEDRLNRETLTNYDCLNNEAVEEMTAEFTAAFIINTLGLDDTKRQSDYIFYWAKYSDNSEKGLIEAVTNAAKAAEYILDKAS